MNKYILGAQGSIGSALLSQSKDWVGITRHEFNYFLNEIIHESDCEIINAATLGVNEISHLVSALNKGKKKHILHHLSSAIVEFGNTEYANHKKYEENYLKSCLSKIVDLKIYRLDLPFANGRTKNGFGYWDNLDLGDIRLIISDRNFDINELLIDLDFNVRTIPTEAIGQEFSITVYRLRMLTAILNVLPIKLINKYISSMKIGIFR